MSQNTLNTTAFIEAQQYSKFIIDNLWDVMLPDTFVRDVTDFGAGTTLNIKTVGDVVIQDVAEDQALLSTPIDTGTVTLSITDYIGKRWHITDELRMDGSQIEQLSGMHAANALRAIHENVETKFLAAANAAQTNNNANLINSARHRIAGNGASRQIELQDFAYMRFAFDKARAPNMGRIAIVDPIVEMTLNTLTNLVNVSNNPMFEGIVTEGFAREHRFVKNIFGWDIYVSNFLPREAAIEGALTDRDGNVTASVVGDIANVFMCVADDNTRPMMRAWRQMPKTEGWRNPELRRDEFQVTSRFGYGAQRTDTLGVILTSPTAY